MGLEIGGTFSPSQKNNGLMPLPTVYSLRDENLFRIKLQAKNTKLVKADNEEVETAIWNDAAAEISQGGYRANHHELFFQHLRNIMA